jgi:hypothetical protein
MPPLIWDLLKGMLLNKPLGKLFQVLKVFL